ncbi:MAG: Uma2 family endonuclease [Pirellulaceae bacterium]
MSMLASPTVRIVPRREVPLLENGDHLTRQEFKRRWEAMPDLKRAELIEGVVYMGAALRHRQHGQPHGLMLSWLSSYYCETPGLEFGVSASVELDDANEPQPDCYLFLPTALGSRAIVNAEGYLEGPLDLIAEIAASSASIDLHKKKQLYERHGVQEYIVWRTTEGTMDWFVLENGRYVPLDPDAAGVLRSRRFPGLWLDAAAMVRGDARRIHEVLDQGLATPDHAAFVQLLSPHVKP